MSRIVNRIDIKLETHWDVQAARELVPLWDAFCMRAGQGWITYLEATSDCALDRRVVQAAQTRIHARAQVLAHADSRTLPVPPIGEWEKDLRMARKPAPERLGRLRHRIPCDRKPGCPCFS